MSRQSRGPTVYELLSKPFGPFLDSIILSPECKTTPQKPVELKDVLLQLDDDEPTGLTFSEWSQPESPHYRPGHGHAEDSGDSVELRGLLSIKKLSWLSKEGQNLLTQALRRRDYNIRRKKHGAATRESNLTLKHVFNEDGKLRMKRTYIKVILKATKQGPAVYMNSEKAPGALVLRTADHNRNYKVLGMNPRTYQKSHLFLSRYRVLHDIRTIANLPLAASTPLIQRTPDWFATQFVEHLLHRETARARHGYRSNSESQDSSDSDDSEARPPPNKRRRVQHNLKAEVLSLLAVHAEWLVGEQRRQKQNKFFDPIAWDRFRAMASQYRLRGRLENLQWGTFRGEPNAFKDDADSSASEDSMGERVPRRRARRKRTSHHQRSSSPDDITPEVEQTPSHLQPPADTYENHYDSDFTTASSSSASTDTDSLCSRPTSPSPAFAAKMPAELLVPPKMPRNGPWICHVHGCLYDINLQDLRREQMALLHPQDAAFVRAGRWCLDDPVIVGCFAKLASEHFKDHLTACGLVLVKEGRKVRPDQFTFSGRWQR
ncbi:hypothetical protein BC629DRAFT_1685875 [Irpex lacteus]|nr:hypothetical protein BC629DRAFT_1685875 [Irpex lacteus]